MGGQEEQGNRFFRQGTYYPLRVLMVMLANIGLVCSWWFEWRGRGRHEAAREHEWELSEVVGGVSGGGRTGTRGGVCGWRLHGCVADMTRELNGVGLVVWATGGRWPVGGAAHARWLRVVARAAGIGWMADERVLANTNTAEQSSTDLTSTHRQPAPGEKWGVV